VRIAVRLSWVGWNKRSGSTQRERDIKVRSVIDAYLESPLAGEPLLHEGFFTCFKRSGCWFFCQWWWAQRLFVLSYRLLVEPLRLFHPTVLLSVLKRAEQKPVMRQFYSLSG